MKLKDKVAIITGASRGLGKAFALGFAKEGANIVIAARTEVEGKLPGTIYGTANEIRTLGRQALPVRCDVTSEESVQEMVKKTLKEFGRIDILVNNAGIARWSPLMETSLKQFELVMRDEEQEINKNICNMFVAGFWDSNGTNNNIRKRLLSD